MYDLFRAFAERDRYSAWLHSERTKRKPAVTQNKIECIRCGYCCLVRTCVPLPNELDAIASYLEINVAEMIARFMVGDKIEGHYFLRWANTEQTGKTGQFLDDWSTYDHGQCVLFDESDRVCKIYPVRPADAREMHCWGEDKTERYGTLRKWQEGDLQALCPEMDIYDDFDDDW